jgi:hypothetical protein
VGGLTAQTLWLPLRDELVRREDAGFQTHLWLRDDDATQPTAALDRLLDLTGQYAIPVTIAAVPAQSADALAQHLAGFGHATPVIHGLNHVNYAPGGEKKQELGNHRPLESVLSDLTSAIQRMANLHGKKLVAMLVPPWNRIGTNVLPHLSQLGFTALSCFGDAQCETTVPVFNTQIDLIDWHGTRGCHNHAMLVTGLAEYLQRPGQTADPIGILGHHLVHDEAAWRFLEELFALTYGFSGCRWMSAAELIDARLGTSFRPILNAGLLK